MSTTTHDYDWLVIGSGFGGSVAALRLAEKGYRVAVLEMRPALRRRGLRRDDLGAERYYWMPKLGLKGILRLTLFKDVFIASGCGVGGGSLGYANTLYRARPGSTATASGPTSPTGSASWLRTTRSPSACWA